ncbi:MAG: rod shape-determining protein MreD [Candidatus Hydrogenedentes bacterium]|jgi:rod shape-determining protein MreD|nr:rod shape-determining protein MreD [Candidatus Hydrogenedentota bacterium]
MIRIRHHTLPDYLFWLASVIVAALLQTNWPEMLKFQEVSPDIVLVIVVYFAIAFGEERAMFTALIGGLYLDVAANTTLGHHVFCYVLIGYFFGRLSTRLITEHEAIKAGLVFLASLMQGFLFLTIQFILEPQRGMLLPLVTNAVPTAFYSAVLTPLVFIAVERIFHRREAITGGVV